MSLPLSLPLPLPLQLQMVAGKVAIQFLTGRMLLPCLPKVVAVVIVAVEQGNKGRGAVKQGIVDLLLIRVPDERAECAKCDQDA